MGVKVCFWWVSIFLFLIKLWSIFWGKSLIFCFLWEVWKLLKKCSFGILVVKLVVVVMRVKLWVFWIELEFNMVKFVFLVVIILLWFLKIDRFWVVKEWVVICKIMVVNFLVILCILGNINIKFWEVVNVVVKVFDCRVLWIVLVVFFLFCIFIINGMVFYKLGWCFVV